MPVETSVLPGAAMLTPASSSDVDRPSRSDLAPVDPRHIPNWDARILAHPGGTVFHAAAWTSAICQTYSFTPIWLVADSLNGAPAALPLIEVDSPLTGRRGIGLPFTDESPALTNGRFSWESLFDAAQALGRQRRWKSLELRGIEAAPESVSASLEFYSHILELGTSADALFCQFDSKLRNKLRQAERAQLTFEVESSMDSLRNYYRLHCLTRQKHGVPPQPFKFFESIFNNLIAASLGFVASVRRGGELLASAVFLHANGLAHYKFSASKPDAAGCRPNDFLLWRAIQHCVVQGFKAVDLGRTSLSNEGLRQYKAKWSAREKRLRYCRWDFASERFSADLDRASGPANVFFRACPPALNRLFGRLLYPHIA